MSTAIIITEQQVLACFLNKPELLENKKDCYFQNETSLRIYNALKKLKHEKSDFLTSTIVASCDDSDIDFSLIDGIKDDVEYSIDSFDYYHKRLTEEYIKSSLLKGTLKNAMEGLLEKGDLRPDVLDNLIRDAEDAKRKLAEKTKLLDMATLLETYEHNMDNLGDNNHFVSSGCHYLDNRLYGGGFELGQITTIFGNSGNGKSIFTEKLINGKINKQEPTLYVPTEMGQLSTMDRLVAMRTGIPIDDLSTIDEMTGKIPDYVKEEFLKEKRRLTRNKSFRLLDESGLSISDIKNAGIEMKKLLGVDYLSIYIDLGSMLLDFSGDNKASKYEDALNELLSVAKAENFAIIPVFQTKRKDTFSVSDYADCKKFAPTIELLKNSGAIEERSRIVLSVFRQKHYGERLLGKDDPEVMIADDIMEVAVQKQNNGPLSVTKYLYAGEIARLTYYVEEEKEEIEE